MTKRPIHLVPVDNAVADLFASISQLPDFTGGSCVGADPELFFPETMAQAREAVALCNSCPLIDQCPNWAIEHEDHGIWGGKTARQRALLRKGRKSSNPAEAVKAAEFREALEGRESARVLAERFNVTDRTIYRWRKLIKQGKEVG